MHETAHTTASSSLAGKTIIVTGGARGLGAAISTACVQHGASVVLVGRDSDRLAAHAATLGGGASWVAADLSKPDAPASVIADTVLRFGAVDGVVNNAGTAFLSPIEHTRPADIDHVLALDVRAPLLLMRAAASVLPAGGSIVNISSAMSAIGQPATALYAAAKGGLDAATRALAAELGGRGIRVNAVRPGLTRTDATEDAYRSEALLAQYHSTVPLARTGTTEEVASTVRFLLSDESSFITGQVIAVDGGHTTANLSVFSPASEYA